MADSHTRLANYTTTVAAEKSVAEITSLLVQGGATKISFDFARGPVPIAVRFEKRIGESDVAFLLPCSVSGAKAILERQRKRGVVTDEHARNVAWRCLRGWLRAQLALIEIGSVKLEQVMLPYAVLPDGETVYARMLATSFGAKALPPAEGAGR